MNAVSENKLQGSVLHISGEEAVVGREESGKEEFWGRSGGRRASQGKKREFETKR